MASLTNGLSKLSIDASPTASSTATSSPPSLQPSSSSDGSSNASSPSLSPTVSRNSSDRSAGRSAANPVSLSKARTHKGFDDVFTKNQLSRRETKKYDRLEANWLYHDGRYAAVDREQCAKLRLQMDEMITKSRGEQGYAV